MSWIRIPPEQLIFLWKQRVVSGVVVLYCIVFLCLLSRLIMYMYIHWLFVFLLFLHTVAGTVQDITVDEYHNGFRVFWNKHSLADNEGISYHLQVHSHVCYL